MVNKTLEHVKPVRAKGRWYYYFRTGQFDAKGREIRKRLPDMDAPNFFDVYAAMLGHRTRRANVATAMTLKQLVDLYMSSDKFRKMAANSQTLYTTYLHQLVALLGPAPAQELERKDFVLLLDRMANKPAAANIVLAVARGVYRWGRDRGHVTVDPLKEIDAMEVGEHQPWPMDKVHLALACDDDRARLAVHLLYYTGQRIGDVIRMRWSDIQDGRIFVRQQKTGKELLVPLHPALVKELARHPRSLTTIIPGTKGKPILAVTVRKLIQNIVGAGHVPHGLRKNAVIALLECECTMAEVSAITGQSLGMVEYYAKGRVQRGLADSAILKWKAHDK